MTVSQGRWIALLGVTAMALYLCWQIVQPFIDVILWAVVLAIVAYPHQRRMLQRGHSRTLAATVTTLMVVLVVLVPTFLVGVALIREAASAKQSMADLMQDVWSPDSRPYQFISQYVDLSELHNSQEVAKRFSDVIGVVIARSTGVLGGLFGFFMEIFFVLFTLFYMLRDADRIVPALQRLLPISAEESSAIFMRGREVIYASFMGVVLIAALQGVLGGAAFWLLGLEAPILWALVMFLLAMIPFGGAFLVWAPAALWLGVDGHPLKAVILLVWGLLVVGTVDNVLRPRIVGQRTQLHELVIFFSVLGGLQVFGMLGLFVGPAVIAITLLLVEVCRQASVTGIPFSPPTGEPRSLA
ncbi:MAG: AI-2E family transporter [Pirellulales bacterium]|nr:AI-2E family transporter [Pirellulales bacterium]